MALHEKEGVTITRPVKTAEVRVHHPVESFDAEELAGAAAQIDECEGKRAAGGLEVSWRGTTKLLPARLLQCYRCHAHGHVQAACKEAVDRSAQCYRCGEMGHTVTGCTGQPHCPVCKERGLASGHKAGGPACPLPKIKGRWGTLPHLLTKGHSSSSKDEGSRPSPASTQAPPQKRERPRREERKRKADREELASPVSAAPNAIAPSKRKRLRVKIGGASGGDEMEAEVLGNVSLSQFSSPSLPIPFEMVRSDPETIPALKETSASTEKNGERIGDWEEEALNKWDE
ncbi:uncharacterized protein LOC126849545 [Cataglyphis hispanica]|uniref:uncharacterized protein LOC126849545 n=1 Tax=Cataglyphis hispanica TaxID=1086592 RepID=UPI00217F27B6|nr:uncharacterized protein LOC126849545 [Cataglyphis hispanica]